MSSDSDARAVLGAQWAERDDGTIEWRGFLGLRPKVVARPPLMFLEWTIDGRPLRDSLVFSNGRTCEDITFLTEGARADELAIGSLRVLLGEHAADVESRVRYDDGRVGLLFCPGCGGLDCGGVSAEIRATDTTVEWRNVGYQDSWHPFDPKQDVSVFTLRFDRSQYETTVRGLLAWWDG
ncbi:hypothetical protein CH252_07695 [Rhodococcus sp. 06-1477-1B]|nr:hypothetical protein CH252_07695 [Rhodococcus sp. 06-1477-1B]